MDNIQKKEFWLNHIKECGRSDLSQIEYCTTHQIPLSTFGYWKRKLKKDDNCNPVFYPLAVSPELCSKSVERDSGLTLNLQDGRYSIEIEKGFSASVLSQLVHALEKL